MFPVYIDTTGGTTVSIECTLTPMAGSGPMVLVIDAHELVASSLAIALRRSGFGRVGTADPNSLCIDGEDPSLELAAGDIVLLGLLYGDGRTMLPLIRPLALRGCRVMVMTSDQALPLAGECLERGAEMVLDKAMSFERLVAALRRLISGGCAMTDEERTALLENVERHDAAAHALHKPFKTLTQREAEVFAALVAGAAPKHIAHVSGITVHTVRGHIHRVLSKLEVSSQREALAMARHAGWP